jgi:hypothetical protein
MPSTIFSSLLCSIQSSPYTGQMYPVFLLHNTPFICLATKAAANAIQLCSLFDIDIIAVLLALGGHDSGGRSCLHSASVIGTSELAQRLTLHEVCEINMAYWPVFIITLLLCPCP